MTDLPGGVEGDPSCLGLLNMFYEPEKFPDPKPFLHFNRETVILISALAGDRILGAGESKPITLSVSHYGALPVKDGKLTWKVRQWLTGCAARRLRGCEHRRRTSSGNRPDLHYSQRVRQGDQVDPGSAIGLLGLRTGQCMGFLGVPRCQTRLHRQRYCQSDRSGGARRAVRRGPCHPAG